MEGLLPIEILAASHCPSLRREGLPAPLGRLTQNSTARHVLMPQLYLSSPIAGADPPIAPSAPVLKNEAEARRFVDEQKRNGADFIKVYGALSRSVYSQRNARQEI